MHPSPRNAALVTAGGALALVLLPELFLLGYAAEDAYLCGDLGSLGAGISGWFVGLLVFVGCVVAATSHSRRLRLLLVLPLGVVAHVYLSRLALPFGVPLSPCHQTSLLVPLAVVGGSAALTWLLARRA